MRDGTYETLCPPLQALVSIMVNGEFEGKNRQHPEFRKMFTKEYVLNSEWYKKRLQIKQQKDIAFWTSNISYMESVLTKDNYKEAIERLGLKEKLQEAKQNLEAAKSSQYLDKLFGTLGADPLRP